MHVLRFSSYDKFLGVLDQEIDTFSRLLIQIDANCSPEKL